jgi:hypothetical protein
MNTILSLPLIIATGMIVDFTDNVVDAKYLICPPFPIKFCRATKTIPADGAHPMSYIAFKDVQQVLQKTNAYITGVCKGFTSAVSVSSFCFSGSTKSGDNNHSDPGNDNADGLGTNNTAALCLFYCSTPPIHGYALDPNCFGAQHIQ